MENTPSLSKAQQGMEVAFREFLERRDEESAKKMIPAFMGLTISEAIEHKGCHVGMLEDIFDEMRLQSWQGDLKEVEVHLRNLLMLVLTDADAHVRLEYCLNRWLYNRDDEYAKEIREIAKTNERVSEFLKSDVETRAVLEVVI